MNSTPLTFPATHSANGLATMFEGGLYGLSGRALTIAKHLKAMRTGERHLINGLVVRCVANSAGCGLSYDVGSEKYLPITHAVDVLIAIPVA